jgi:MarR-like DNA-binding transcriptional regulator SgrR of sgrS sRNA
MYATCANLLYYPDSAGTDGTRLRPEIAASMPTVSKNGRTYTFRIRPGYRFSPPSGEAVTARTFQRTLERSLSPKNVYSAGPRLTSDVLGVSAYRAGKAAHIQGIVAHGSTLAITLVKPAGDFLTRLSMFAFCPVPMSVPIHVKGFAVHPIPSAGPYYIASIQGERTVLKQNPNYPGPRPRRAERIVYTNNIPTPTAVSLADRGAVDVLPWDFDNTTPLMTVGGVLDRRKGAKSAAARGGKQQYFLYQAPLLDAIAFNTRRQLFRDARLRRAVNYALDRPALAAAFADTPSDQLVPAAVRGLPTRHMYPIDGPDFATARRLAGRRRRHAVIAICGDARLPRLAEIVVADLARIRIAARVIQSRDCPGRAEEADLLFVFPIGSDELDPAPFLDQVLGGSVYGSALGPGPWSSRAFRSRLERAHALRGPARTAAFRELDDQLMRMAPLAVYGDWVWAQYLSPKVGCKVFQAEYGFVDLGALCKNA